MISKSTLLIFTLFFSLYGMAPVMAKEAAEKPSKATAALEGLDETASGVAEDRAQTTEDAAAAFGDLSEPAPLIDTAAPAEDGWAGYTPDVKVSKWGTELRIIVTPNPAMKKDKKLDIQSVKLESEKGEFLGLKTYGPKETDRTAEFMVNPEILKIDKVKLTATSKTDGDWVHFQSLEVKAEPPPQEASEAASEKAAAPAAAPQTGSEKPKKKGLFW